MDGVGRYPRLGEPPKRLLRASWAIFPQTSIHPPHPAFVWKEKNTLQSNTEPRILGLDDGPALVKQSQCGSYLPWFCLQIDPKWAFIVKSYISRLGYEPYLPVFLNRGLKVPAIRPYIPGYIFVSFDPDVPGWQVLSRGAYGVRKLFMNKGLQPAVIHRADIDRLKAMERRDSAVEREFMLGAPMPPLIQPGLAVDVVDGPLVGRVGFCIWSTDRRVRIQFEQIAVELKRTDVKVSDKCLPTA